MSVAILWLAITVKINQYKNKPLKFVLCCITTVCMKETSSALNEILKVTLIRSVGRLTSIHCSAAVVRLSSQHYAKIKIAFFDNNLCENHGWKKSAVIGF